MISLEEVDSLLTHVLNFDIEALEGLLDSNKDGIRLESVTPMGATSCCSKFVSLFSGHDCLASLTFGFERLNAAQSPRDSTLTTKGSLELTLVLPGPLNRLDFVLESFWVGHGSLSLVDIGENTEDIGQLDEAQLVCKLLPVGKFIEED